MKTLHAFAIAAVAGLASLTAGAADAQDKLRYGLLRVASQTPFFVGVERGYFEEVGIDLELVYFDAAVPVTLAIVSGDVDVGGIGITSAFYNMAAEGGVKIFMGHGREMPGMNNTGVFVSNAAWEAGLDSMEKVAGHSIALTALGATNHVAMAMIADKYGFDLADSRLVPAQSVGNVGAMLKGGQVEVGAAAASGIMPLVDAGEVKLLGWAGDEVSFQLAAFATTPAMIEDRRDVLERFAEAYQRGVDDYNQYLVPRDADGNFTHPAEAEAMLEIVSKYTDVPVAALAQSISYIGPELDVQSVIDQQDWHHAQGFIAQVTDPAEFLDLSFVPGHENVPAAMAGAQ